MDPRRLCAGFRHRRPDGALHADDRGSTTDGPEPRLRRAGGGTRGDGGVLSPHSGALPVHDGRPRARASARLLDVHREFDGLRETAGAAPDAAGDVPGAERRQPVAAGTGRGEWNLSGRGAWGVAPLPRVRDARPSVRRLADHPDRRGRHANGHLAAELLCRIVGLDDGLRAGQPVAHRRRRPRRVVGPDPVDHHVQGHEPVLHQRIVRWLWSGGGGRRCQGAAALPERFGGGGRLGAHPPPHRRSARQGRRGQSGRRAFELGPDQP